MQALLILLPIAVLVLFLLLCLFLVCRLLLVCRHGKRLTLGILLLGQFLRQLDIDGLSKRGPRPLSVRGHT